MNYEKVLNKLESNELTPDLAYKELYPVKKTKPGKRAHFIKMRIHVPDEGKKVNGFLKVLFALPIPIMFARIGLGFAKRFTDMEDQEIDFNEIARLLKYSKHTCVSIDSKDAQIDIKII